VHRGAPSRTEPVDGNPVTKLFEGDREGGGGPTLVFMDGKAG
jgi:hypothetical protein